MNRQSSLQLTVDLTYACNYKCPYCVLPPRTKPRPVSEWLWAFGRLRGRFDRIGINFTGGEPSVYPGFFDLAKALADDFYVGMCTNLWWESERLAPGIPPERFKIIPTFHPSQTEFEDFCRRLFRVRDYVARSDTDLPFVNFVAHPDHMPRMDEYKSYLERHDFVLLPLPLGSHSKREIENTESEMASIEATFPQADAGEMGRMECRTGKFSPKGHLCHAGQTYAMINADGRVRRCSRYEEAELGDFFSENFAFWPEPKVCAQEWCPFEHMNLLGPEEEEEYRRGKSASLEALGRSAH